MHLTLMKNFFISVFMIMTGYNSISQKTPTAEGEYKKPNIILIISDDLTHIAAKTPNGPGIIKNKKPHPAHVSNVDIMPTICDMLNVDLPEGLQGRSLWPLLTGKNYPKEEFSSIIVQQGYGGLHFTALKEYDPYTQDGNLKKGKIQVDELNTWTQSGTMRMLRKDDWKLIYDMQGKGELYNEAKDPAEIKNLYANKSYLNKQMELLQDMMAWELRTVPFTLASSYQIQALWF